MTEVLEWLGAICLLTGGLLGVVGGIGMHRFPDFYSRLHAAGTTDTLCAGLFLLGLGLQAGWSLAAAKLLLIFGFLIFTSPTATHSLAKAAYHSGLRPWSAQPERESGP